MIGWLNVGSLVLGLIALILPAVNLIRYPKPAFNHWAALSIISMSACAISLFFQILTGYYRVKEEDWAGFFDVMDAKVFAAAVLLIITIILNAVTMMLFHNRTVK